MQDEDEPQLDLFAWDAIKIGKGYEYLEELDFEKALNFFDEVLCAAPNNIRANRAEALASYWRDVFLKLKSLEGDEALKYLWKEIKKYPFEKGYGLKNFKATLCGKLVLLMEEDPLIFIPPDLCVGNVYMNVNDCVRAEEAFRKLLDRYPEDGRIEDWLATALFVQGKESEARMIYARHLLRNPEGINLEEMKDVELLELINETGLEMAPAVGWLRRLLPLLDTEMEAPGIEQKGGREAYCLLYEAEKARRSGNHSHMVERRRLLKEKFPDIFEMYMDPDEVR